MNALTELNAADRARLEKAMASIHAHISKDALDVTSAQVLARLMDAGVECARLELIEKGLPVPEVVATARMRDGSDVLVSILSYALTRSSLNLTLHSQLIVEYYAEISRLKDEVDALQKQLIPAAL